MFLLSRGEPTPFIPQSDVNECLCCVTSPVVSLGLRLACDGVHDGVLRVHADGRVVLGVDDGGLAAGALHLDGLVRGKGGVEADGGQEVMERRDSRRRRWRGRM